MSEWPRIGRGPRAGDHPTELQRRIIEFVRRNGMAPFGEPSTLAELAAEFPVDNLHDELEDAILAGWLKAYLNQSVDVWERPRPERTDLPVEERQARKDAGDGAWKDGDGVEHIGDMAFIGDAEAGDRMLNDEEREQRPGWALDEQKTPTAVVGFACASGDYWWCPAIGYSIPAGSLFASEAEARNEAINVAEADLAAVKHRLTTLRAAVSGGGDQLSETDEDLERLAQIADRVLAGEPIETFDLGRFERAFVLGYTRRAVDNFMDPPNEPGGVR